MKSIIILAISVTAIFANAQIVRSTIANADKDTNYHGPFKVEAINEALTVVKRRKTVVGTNIVSISDGKGGVKGPYDWLMLHFGADGKLDLWGWGM